MSPAAQERHEAPPTRRTRARWRFARVLLRPVLRCVFDAVVERSGWQYPHAGADVRESGIDPVRVLIIGDGPAAGCGVLLHEMGVAGALARYVSRQTQRGVHVTVDAQPIASARSTLHRVSGMDLSGYDAIVLMLAATDAFCLTSRRSWDRSMTGLVRRLASSGCESVLVARTASRHLMRSSTLFRWARPLIDHHAALLDADALRICARFRTPVIALGAVEDPTPRTYVSWGSRIGADIVASLAMR